ncbi:hypothetical protein OAH34_00930 [bacterium]|nr:hypothetical protein [bacterium]
MPSHQHDDRAYRVGRWHLAHLKLGTHNDQQAWRKPDIHQPHNAEENQAKKQAYRVGITNIEKTWRWDMC